MLDVTEDVAVLLAAGECVGPDAVYRLTVEMAGKRRAPTSGPRRKR